MASSYEISQMFAQQNAMFMGHGQMAQSIGIASPPLSQVGMGNSGVGAYGMGFAPRPGGFHYGQPQIGGYGPGNSIAAGVMSAGSAGISAGSMLTGGLAMAGIGGAAMGAASIGLAPLAMAAPFMAAGGQHQGQVNSMLGNQYQFFNPMSRSGSGFTRDDSKAIGDSIRQLSHIPDLMTNVEEMTRIASRLKSSGLMQGVNSAADFQHRFKEAISTIRDTAKILGTTMEEAEQFFSQSRGAGFYGKSAQLKNAVSAQFTSAVTGASVGQVLGAQQAGADMAASFGARRGLGATAINRIAQNIGLAQQNGNIGENSVEDVTGIAGPEGQLALAQRMFGGMMRFGDTAPGRLAMAGMMKYENGRAVGVDEDMARKLNQGLIGHRELMARAGNLTNDEKISFTNRRADLITSLAGQIGPGGAYGMMKGVMGDHFGGNAEATKLVMGRLTGMNAGELDIAEGMEGVSGEGVSGAMAQLKQRHNQQREQSDPRAIMSKIKSRLRGATIGKLEQAGADIQNSIAKSIDNFFDDVVGTQVSTLTEEKARALSAAFSGSQSTESREMLKSLTGMTGSATLKGGGSGMGDFIASLTGSMSDNQRANYTNKMFGTNNIAKQMGLAATLRGGDFAGKGAVAQLNQIMSTDAFGALKTDTDRMDAITSGLEANVGALLKRLPPGIGAGIKDGRLSPANIEELMKGAGFSEDEKSLLRSFSSASKSRLGGVNVYAQMAAASSKGAGALAAGLAGGGIGSLAHIQESFRTANKELSEAVGETAAGFIGGGSKQAAAFEKVISDPDLANVIINSQGMSTGEVRALLASKEIYLNDKEASALMTSTRSFHAARKDVGKAKAAMGKYKTASDALAGGEFLKNIGDYGTALGNAAEQAGGFAGAQKELASAMSALGSEGSAGIGKWREAYDKYSKGIQGLKGKDLERAIAAGGSVARSASEEGAMAGKLRGSKMSAAELAKTLGISTNDILDKSIGFTEGQGLSEEQAKKLAHLGAQQKALALAQGMDSPTGGKEQDLAGALKQLNTNQVQIAALLATLSKDPKIKGELTELLSSMRGAPDPKGGSPTSASTVLPR